MADQGLINFVITSRSKGMTDADITEILSKNSWTTIQIDEALVASQGLNNIVNTPVAREPDALHRSVKSSLNFVGVLYMAIIGYVQVSSTYSILTYGTDGIAGIYAFLLVLASVFAMLRISFFYSQKNTAPNSSESFFVRILAITTLISVVVLFISFV